MKFLLFSYLFFASPLIADEEDEANKDSDDDDDVDEQVSVE